MKERIKSRLIFLLTVLFLVAFHAANTFHFVYYGVISPAGCSTALPLFGFTLQVPRASCEPGGTSKDLSTTTLRGLGHTVKYLVGQFDRKVVVGKSEPGQPIILFFRPSLNVFDREAKGVRTDYFLSRTRKLREFFSGKGVTFLNLPLPSKPGLLRELLPAKLPSTEVFLPNQNAFREADVTQKYRSIVESDPDYTVDLYPTFQKFEHVYLPWGYHLSSLGLSLAVRGVAEKARSLGAPIRNVRLKEHARAIAFQPDMLQNLMQLPPSFISRRPEFQWREPMFSVEGTLDRAPEFKRIVLIADSNGLSYAKTEHNLGVMLGNVFKLPVVDFTLSGQGGIGALHALVKAGVAFEEKDLVIFEFEMMNEYRRDLEALGFPKVLPSPARRDAASQPH